MSVSENANKLTNNKMLIKKIDPEAMEEMQGQEVPQMPNFEMPDIAATLAKFSTGGGSPQPSSSKKRQ